jgi:hypothetical protein
MFTPPPKTPEISSPADARARLTALRSERLDATESGLGGNALYMNQLDADIATSETVYVLLAVGEIASLRADLDGELVG